MNTLKIFYISIAIMLAMSLFSKYAFSHDTCDYKMNWSLVHSEYLDDAQELLYWDYENDGSIDSVWHVETVKGKCHLLGTMHLDTAETIMENRNKHLLKWGE